MQKEQISTMDGNAKSQKEHVCFFIQIVKHVRNSMEKDQMQKIMRSNRMSRYKKDIVKEKNV